MAENSVPTEQFIPTSAPKRNWRRFVRPAIMVAAVAMIALYVAGHWEDFLIVRNIGFAAIVWVVILDGLIYIYGAAAIHAVVRVFGVKTGAWESWMLSMATRFGNILMPLRGGAFVRALYLNKVHRLPYSHFLAGLSARLLGRMTVSIVCALGGLVYLYASTGRFMLQVSLILTVALVAICLLTIFRPRMTERGSALRRQLARLVNGWDLMCVNRASIAALLALNLLHILTMTTIYVLLLADMGQPISWGLLITIVSLGQLSMIFQITPGNVGVYEGALTIIGSLAGLSAAGILAAALTWRIVDAILVLSIGPFCNHALTSKAISAGR